MQIALFAYKGNVSPVASECLKSLRRHNPDCVIKFFGEVDNPELLAPVEVEPFPCNEWEPERMTNRMKLARRMGMHGDEVMMFDTDIVFRKDPFRAFKRPFHMAYTTRPWRNDDSPVNGGVTAWRVGSQTTTLWNWMIKQAYEPTWLPYLEQRRLLGRQDRAKELDWWSHQDLLCAMARVNPPIPTHVVDLGPLYNWCPNSGGGRAMTDEVKAQFLSEIHHNQDIIAIHYKELEQHVQPRDFIFE